MPLLLSSRGSVTRSSRRFAVRTIARAAAFGGLVAARRTLQAALASAVSPTVERDIRAALDQLGGAPSKAARRAAGAAKAWLSQRAPIVELRSGRIYRRRELHDGGWGGNRQSGISYPAGGEHVLLFSDPAKAKEHGYRDRWTPDGIYHYYGEWSGTGDMTLSGGNQAIIDRSPELHLFIAAPGGHRYEGQFECVGHEPENDNSRRPRVPRDRVSPRANYQAKPVIVDRCGRPDIGCASSTGRGERRAPRLWIPPSVDVRGRPSCHQIFIVGANAATPFPANAFGEPSTSMHSFMAGPSFGTFTSRFEAGDPRRRGQTRTRSSPDWSDIACEHSKRMCGHCRRKASLSCAESISDWSRLQAKCSFDCSTSFAHRLSSSTAFRPQRVWLRRSGDKSTWPDTTDLGARVGAPLSGRCPHYLRPLPTAGYREPTRPLRRWQAEIGEDIGGLDRPA